MCFLGRCRLRRRCPGLNRASRALLALAWGVEALVGYGVGALDGGCDIVSFKHIASGKYTHIYCIYIYSSYLFVYIYIDIYIYIHVYAYTYMYMILTCCMGSAGGIWLEISRRLAGGCARLRRKV